MENSSARFSSIGQLFPECVTDEKSRYCQIGSPRAEVICPKPRRANRVPCVLDSLSRLNPKSKCISSEHKGNRGLELMDIILSKDDLESDPKGFLLGSPPVRTNNPMVNDAHFSKQTLPSASPLGTPHRGSPSCGSPLGAKPIVRVEGFSCGSPESSWIVQTFA
ncbi:uncharacterized protein M6B38_345110 [Iris pallida]|uniref:Uncharacterized protein n=1 Tax=Iris pallida TaxID=29817 RepID=A0AAX6GUQ6_IRIPA|nr:uncharacterized protein M6B38_345110 [Iris pallida]